MNESATIKVWDPLLRLFHWSLVVSFAIAYLTGDEEGELHVLSGYVVSGLIAFRILWGIVGPRHARFSDFVTGPGKVVAYLRSLAGGKPQHYLGHNPAGGYMVIALLIALAVTCYSGLAAYGAEGHGPLADGTSLPIASAYADEDNEGMENDHEGMEGGESAWEEIHETAANLTLALVFLHIAGVFVSSRLHRENLVRAMITGRKNKS
ncbi:cytochrome b/b6 domain-containing protein [Mangrovitalea sediminis]|uniref:cytochrome b/b6 domain-containing protein n=1 Tax=Mangrovitalea sediminis TaxID=1982043 RepID=UPI000BE5BCD2|nr:cytochrome b/b6 domain-containing protein [Mangrovitalea sediminis]